MPTIQSQNNKLRYIQAGTLALTATALASTKFSFENSCAVGGIAFIAGYTSSKDGNTGIRALTSLVTGTLISRQALPSQMSEKTKNICSLASSAIIFMGLTPVNNSAEDQQPRHVVGRQRTNNQGFNPVTVYFNRLFLGRDDRNENQSHRPCANKEPSPQQQREPVGRETKQYPHSPTNLVANPMNVISAQGREPVGR